MPPEIPLPGRAERARLSPAQARQLFRAGLRVHTAGWCAGRAQANLIAVPRNWAFELRHVETQRTVPMYRTSVACRPAGYAGRSWSPCGRSRRAGS